MLVGGTASAAAPGKFYSTTNGFFTCSGVVNPPPGTFGSVRVNLGVSTSTAIVHVRHITPNTVWDVFFSNSHCTPGYIGSITTDGRGSGSGSFTFPTDTSGNFWLDIDSNLSGPHYGTPEITF